MIGSGFTQRPKLKSPFPQEREYWTCSKTGLVVPKRYSANLKYREDILRAAEHDPVLQSDILAACTKSCLWWINTFAWTKHEFEVDLTKASGRRPSEHTHWAFITWQIQDELFDWFEDHFLNGKSGLVDKSRDMGASWCGVAFLHWLWLFRPNTEIREMSRSEIYVDSPIAKSLFYKHDYLNTWLPEWMRPPGVMVKGRENRTSMRIYNELNNSTIGGESTTKHAMSADRCAILFLDEFAKVDNGADIRTSTYDVSPCRIVNSTVAGPGTEFSRIVNSTVAGPGTEFSRWKNSGQIDVFSMMFWDHPMKGEGRYIIEDEVTKTFKISSPFIDKVLEECTQKAVAQEYYAIDLEAGDLFFELGELNKHIAFHARPPISQHNIILKEGIADDKIPKLIQAKDTNCYHIVEVVDGKLKVWVELINGRPDQSHTYIFGIDTSKGQGASESVVSIKSKQTGEIIAKWVCRNTPPHEFSRVIVALALWCGGANPQRLPFLKWEKNGDPGWDLGRLLVQVYLYPHYHITKTLGAVVEKVQGTKGEMQKYGYQMTREGKSLLLRAYERALKSGKIINHCKFSLDQAKQYVHTKDGGIEPAELVEATTAEKKLHGDRVIADALTVEDEEVSNPRKTKMTTPARSWGGRKDAWDKKRKTKKNSWQRPYDFTKR
ncbi:MAG: hypothetical protein ACXADF_19470 [Candidatus Thorarchaeota archaeon]|jgi:hypothetical protein